MLSIHVHMIIYRDECFAITILFLAQLKISFKRLVTRPVAQPLVYKLLCM